MYISQKESSREKLLQVSEQLLEKKTLYSKAITLISDKIEEMATKKLCHISQIVEELNLDTSSYYALMDAKYIAYDNFMKIVKSIFTSSADIIEIENLYIEYAVAKRICRSLDIDINQETNQQDIKEIEVAFFSSLDELSSLTSREMVCSMLKSYLNRNIKLSVA